MRALLVLFATMGAAHAAAPFSHPVHLRMKLACVTCHGGATTSTQVSDNLLPDESLCLNCHKQVEIPKPPVTRVAKFNHALHVKLGPAVAAAIAAALDAKTYLSAPGDIRAHLNSTNNVCQACHRGLETSAKVSHLNMPRMADCLVCHNVIEVPFSCEKCHEKGAQLKPVNHTADFIDTHTSGKLGLDKSSCAVCHGRKFNCLGCHTGG